MVESLLQGEAASVLEGSPSAGSSRFKTNEESRTIARSNGHSYGSDHSDSASRLEWDKIRDQYTTALNLAERNIEKARQQAEQAHKALQHDQAHRRYWAGQLASKDALELQREVLQAQRRALQEQMEALDRQIEKLESNADSQAKEKEFFYEENESSKPWPKSSKPEPSK